jgi:dipeptidyl-peptidase-4
MNRLAQSLAMTTLLASAAAAAQPLTVERLVASPALEGPAAKGVQISPDGTRVSFLQGRSDDQEQQDLWEYHIADGEKRLLVDSRALTGGSEQLDEAELARRERQRIFASGIVEYQWSPDGQALLFPLGGDLYYLPLGAEPRRLTSTPATETDAKVSPGGGFVSFVRERNLFVIDLASGLERQLTTAGGGTISCGVAEFVAQEEMYRNTGYWWSPDDARIAFACIDEAGVQEVDRYEIGADGVTSIAQRYPFAGTPNAVVQLFVVDLASGDTREVSLGDEPDIYLARVNFSPDGTLAVQRQSRDQKTLELLFVEPGSLRQSLVLTERQPHWVNLHSDLTFIDGGERFLWTSERSGYNHIYLYRKDGTLERQLTDGEWMVAPAGRSGGGIKAVDEQGGQVWFAGWRRTPTERHLYRVSLEGGPVAQLTEDGGWHEATVAPSAAFFVDNGQAPMRPPYTAIRAANGQMLAYITENPLDASHPYAPYLPDHRPHEFGTLEAEDGTPLHYQLTLPADFDPALQYPAIVFLYGGPGAGQQVRKVWPVAGRSGLNQLLARQGYVVFTLDNRGTPNRGKAFEDVLYRNMGDVEVRDQLQGLAWLKARPYVDGERVGIHGWSYGGYMTLMMLLKAPGEYAAGIAGAPVTDWRLYDTHYTERYMGDPNDGAGRYEVSSPMTYAAQLADPMLIIHGMADDNVFFDHTVKMIDALQEAGKPFEMMTYPGKRHRITGEAETAHLWRLHLDFFNRTLRALELWGQSKGTE